MEKVRATIDIVRKCLLRRAENSDSFTDSAKIHYNDDEKALRLRLMITNDFAPKSLVPVLDMKQPISNRNPMLLVRNTENNALYVRKTYHFDELADLSRLDLLVQFLLSVRNKNIIKIIGYEVDKPNFHVYIRYGSRGDLANIYGNKGVADEREFKYLVKQILNGLDELHANGIIHLDIKPENIIIDDEHQVKIIDFGSVLVKGGSPYAHQFYVGQRISGTPHYMAPEILKSSTVTTQSDVWSCGCTFWYLINGKNPWAEYKNMLSLMYSISSETIPINIDADGKISYAGIQFVKSCLEMAPKNRPTVAQLLKHPYLNED